MAEALGVAGSIIAIIQISDQVVSACYQYFTTARDAVEDIRRVIDVVSGLKSILANLQSLINTDAARQYTQLQLDSLNEPINACQSDLVKLETRLNIKIDRDIPKRVRLMWPFKKKEVEGILQGIEKHKTTFILALSGEILQTSLAIKDDVSAVNANITDQRYEKIINWLRLSDPSTNHNTARSKHEPSTGDWFLQSDAFIHWRDGKIGSLWLHGIPGAGKTILCSTIIEHVKALCKADPPLQYAYFYFDFNDREKQTVVGMLRSMIVQLSSSRIRIPPEIDKLYMQCKEGKEEPGNESLVDTLLSLLKSSGRVFLIMDALDECSERGQLVSVVARVLQQEVSLLLTSRKEQDLSEGLQDLIEAAISLKGCGVDGDISKHIRKCLESDRCLRKWSPSVRHEIENALARGAHGMFRWVECQLETLRRCFTVLAVRQSLHELPETLDGTYGRILNNIPKLYRREAQCVLQLLAVAYRPLTISEVAEAVVIDCEKNEFKFDRRLRSDEDILEICSCLVALSGKELRFAHYSVKEYLMSTRVLEGTSSYFGVIITQAHQLFTRLALIYLLSVTEPIQLNEGFAKFPFLRYAAKFWHEHFHASAIEGRATPQHALARQLFDPAGINSFRNWLQVHNPSKSRYLSNWRAYTGPNPLYYAIVLGLFDLTKELLDGGADIQAITEEGQGREAASYESFEEDPFEEEPNCRYALTLASRFGHFTLTQLLVERGAQVNLIDENGNTALYTASVEGHEGVVRFLVEKGAKINSQGGKYGNALQAASNNGYEAVVRFLVGKGADINVQGGCYGNALQAASENGNEAVVRFLVEKGAEINAQGGYYGNALQAASDNGNEAVVRFLVEKGAEINAQGGYYGNALVAASRHGNEAVVRFLVEKGADINAQGKYYDSAVQVASRYGNEAVVRFLVEKGADISAQGGFYDNALVAASRHGNEAVVRFLVEKGADINAQGKYYDSAVQVASRYGNEAVVRFLVEKGAESVKFLKN